MIKIINFFLTWYLFKMIKMTKIITWCDNVNLIFEIKLLFL
jgi:hypothetical protein